MPEFFRPRIVFHGILPTVEYLRYIRVPILRTVTITVPRPPGLIESITKTITVPMYRTVTVTERPREYLLQLRTVTVTVTVREHVGNIHYTERPSGRIISVPEKKSLPIF